MKERYYNIHDIVTFRVVTKGGPWDRIFSSWDIELRGFELHSLDTGNPDFVILMDRFTPINQNCAVLDNDYYIKKDYLYSRDYYKYAKWQVEMSDFEQGNTRVRIHSNLLGKMLIPELIINPLIWFKLNEKGYPIVHGSAVTKDDEAYIFAGQGASGKSTIALSLVERGFKLLSEHFVLLDKGTVLSFPTPFHIMDFNLAPILKNNMSPKHKASFQLKQLFRRLTRKRIATKILPMDVLPNSLVDKAKLHSVFLLLPREKLSVKRIDREEMVSHLVANQKLETFPFIKYMMEYSYMFPKSDVAAYWDRYEKNLRLTLDTAEAFYRVEVPLRYEAETVERISKVVSK